MSMEKLTTIIEEIIKSYMFPEDGKEKYGFDTYIDAIIEAVKERDAYVLGEKGIDTEDWISNIYKGVQNELIDNQTKRAEESR